MPSPPAGDLYSIREVAEAAGVSEDQVLAYLDGRQGSSGRVASRPPYRYLSHADAIRVGVALLLRPRGTPSPAAPLFALFGSGPHELGSRRVFAVSSTVHATILGVVVFVASFNLAPHAAALVRDEPPTELMRLVFLATPGPGGGGGGGGRRDHAPAPRAMQEGHQRISSPVAAATSIAPAPVQPQPIASEPFPAVVAPIVSSPSDNRTRIGVLEETAAQNDGRGSGALGGAGTGAGTGLGSGSGAGVGPGSGGGTGGGVYRPGSGIDPPRLLHEVKGDYTEDARRRAISGEVIMEIVVRRDGTVGDVKILQPLGSGLDERAVQAVRQWRFAPAQKQGVPVDVLVEVAMEFKLR